MIRWQLTILPYSFAVCCADAVEALLSRFALACWHSIRVMQKAQTLESFFHLHAQTVAGMYTVACCLARPGDYSQ